MKLSWLGKIMLADAAFDIAKHMAGKVSGRRDEDEEEDDSPFSNHEIKCMMEATERNDYLGFKQIYRDRRRNSRVDDVNRAYEWFQDQKRRGWPG